MKLMNKQNKKNAKLYNKDVLKLLFSYVFTYKRYLFISLFLVLIITGTTLAVPYLLKNIVDKYIFKQGYLVNIDNLSSKDVFYEKELKKGIYLVNNKYFILQSQLKYFSSKEKNQFINEGVFSKNKYVFIESPLIGIKLQRKINILKKNGYILEFPAKRFFINTDKIKEFKVNELYQLRIMDFRNIVKYVLIIVTALIIQFGASYTQIIYLMRLSQYAMKDLRRDLFSHLLSLEVGYFDKNHVGKMVNRVSNDIETMNEMFSSVLITLFQDILMMTGIVIVMILSDIYLALIVATTFPFIVIFTLLFRVKARNAYRSIRTKITELNSFLNESITGIRIIQIFVQEINILRNFRKKNEHLFNDQMKMLYIYAIFRPILSFLRWFAVGAVIYFGARGIINDRITYGLIVMFLAYIENFFSPVFDLSEKFDIMQSATAAGEKILSIFNNKAVKEYNENKDIDEHTEKYLANFIIKKDDCYRFKGKIVFDDVWFSYKPDEWILKGVSFKVDTKEKLAIIGETGSGKSTIINILLKFYKIQKGKIFIDGVNIDDIPYWIIRRNIGTVMQDVFLFSRNIRENVILNGLYNEERFLFVSKITHLNRFLKNLPKGDLEPVMERGSTFSAGEKQLISFARALYFNPSILVLDEATSNIDTETEKLIQDATLHIIKGRTSIIVAHRLSTIRNADKIIVLDKGKIIEEGNHKELLKRKGLYYQFYRLQFDK